MQFRYPSLFAAGMLAAGLFASAAFAGAPPAKRHCITVLYPNDPDVRFDFDYYAKKHATLIRRLYGKGIAKLELRHGLAAADGGKAPYIAVVSIWIGSQAAFDAAAAKHSSELIADVPNFTNAKPLIQTDEILE